MFFNNEPLSVSCRFLFLRYTVDMLSRQEVLDLYTHLVNVKPDYWFIPLFGSTSPYSNPPHTCYHIWKEGLPVPENSCFFFKEVRISWTFDYKNPAHLKNLQEGSFEVQGRFPELEIVIARFGAFENGFKDGNFITGPLLSLELEMGVYL